MYPNINVYHMKTKEPFKWILITILLLSLFTPVTCAQTAALTITDYTIQPEILTPGELGTVTVTIKNTAVNASADITDIYLFAPGFEHDHKNFKSVGTLGGCSSTSITFAFIAPDREGIYFPEIHIVFRIEGTALRDSIRYPFPVRVNERTSLKEAALEVEKVIPAEISPGDDFPLTLKLINKGETTAHNIFLKIGKVDTIYSNDPGNYYIKNLEVGESYVVNLKFRSSEDTPTGMITIPIEITYEGLSSDVKKQSETVGIEVIGRAEVGISDVKTDPLSITKGEDFTLLIRIENFGDGDARSVKATITDLSFSGVKEAFLGKIAVDDDAPAVFTLRSDEGGSFEYNLQISYRDDLGEHTVTEKLSLIVESKESNGTLKMIIPLILIALVSIGLYLHFKERKKK